MEHGARVNLEPAQAEPPPLIRSDLSTSELVELLMPSQAYAAPFFKHLEPRSNGSATGYLATNAGRQGVALHAPTGRATASLYLQGDAGTLSQAMPHIRFPKYSYLTCHESHLPAVKEHFHLRGLQQLLRMQVTPESFQAIPSRAESVTAAQLSKINDLYRTDSWAWVSNQQVLEGPYYGIWDNDRLVSIAGTQSMSTQYGVAMVANVLTHQRYRNQGYASECVSALTERLLQEARLVVLNVDPRNKTALHVYQRLGYQDAGPLAEAWAFWKGGTWIERAISQLTMWFMH